MADTDLIACLYPADDSGVENALEAIETYKETSRYVPPQFSRPKAQYGRRDRAPTEPLQQPNVPAHLHSPCLQLRFSHGPQTPHGFVFGWDPKCDIVLPWMPEISYHHFALTFDEQYRPIVKDLRSLNGTQVTYDNQGHGLRSDFVWIVGGHDVPNEKDSIVIHVNKDLKLQIVVSHYDITSELHIDNVNRFHQGTADAEDLLHELNLRSRPQTERASGAQTPSTRSIVLRKRLGKGGFGIVTHIWDVSTGNEYALKEPTKDAIRNKEVDIHAWKREADVMRQISHAHIIMLLDEKNDPWPKLYLEYVPGGTLRDQKGISAVECEEILRQCLLALVYLHGRQIAHRDISPSNILVQYRDRDSGSIYVKLSDFGLSREKTESHDLKTLCGTKRYVAPEVHLEWDKKKSARSKEWSYTTAVDIWSLGAVIFSCARGLPKSNAQGVDWCWEIISKLREELKKELKRENPDELIRFLSTTMLIMKPELRGSAQDCYDQARFLGNPIQDRSQTPTPASYAKEYQHTTVHFHAGGEGDEDQPTELFRGAGMALNRVESSPSLDDDSIDSAEIQRYIRSGNPCPSSHLSTSVAAGKRELRVSKPASSNRRRTKRSGHSSLAARSSRGQPEYLEPEIEHFYQNVNREPLNSLYVGSSLSALEQELPTSWDQPLESSLPRSMPDSDPHLVVGGTGYARDEYLINTIEVQGDGGRSWGTGGRSWDNGGRSWANGERSWENEEQRVEGAWTDSDEDMAARLLLAIHDHVP